MARLVVDIFEEGDRAPVVRHVFFGKSRSAALRILRAHMRTDSFLRGCVRRGKWKAVVCRAKRRWEG